MQTQRSAAKKRLYKQNFPNKSTNYLHITASAYAGLCLCASRWKPAFIKVEVSLQTNPRLPPDCIAWSNWEYFYCPRIRCQSIAGLPPNSIKFTYTLLYTWVARGIVSVNCLTQELVKSTLQGSSPNRLIRSREHLPWGQRAFHLKLASLDVQWVPYFLSI